MRKHLLPLVIIASYSFHAQTGNVGINTANPGSTLTVNGSFAASYKNVTSANYTMLESDYYLAWNSSSTGTVTLPSVAGAPQSIMGRQYHIKNTGTAVMNIAAGGSELMDNQSGTGVVSISLDTGQYAMLIAKNTTSGTTWEVVIIGDSFGISSSQEPWNVQGTTTPATGNNQLIYQNNNVSIGASSPAVSSRLYVNSSGVNSFGMALANGNSLRTFMVPELAAGAFNSMSGSADAGLFFSGTNGSVITTPSATRGLLIAPWVGATAGLKITESGNVGVGTSTPSVRLHVVSPSNTSGLTLSSTLAPNDYILQSVTDGTRVVSMGIRNSTYVPGFMGTDTAHDFGLRTNGLERLTLQANTGFVGIGTTAPNNQLDLGSTLGGTTTDVVGKKFAVYNNAAGTDFYGLGVSAGRLQFHAGSTPAEDSGMVLRETGSVGIGVLNPVFRLDVATMASGAGILVRGGNSQTWQLFSGPSGMQEQWNNGTGIFDMQYLPATATGGQAHDMKYFNTFGDHVFINTALNARVGINTHNPDANLSVLGTASKTGGGSWLAFSDSRLKHSVNDYHKGLKEILAINPVTFQYNGKAGMPNDGKTYVGVIAQEIEKVLPTTVNTVNKDGIEDLRMYDSSELTYTLINAVKEQQAEIEALKKENMMIKGLEERTKAAENAVKQLTEQIRENAK